MAGVTPRLRTVGTERKIRSSDAVDTHLPVIPGLCSTTGNP